jgi:hypothetical protein
MDGTCGMRQTHTHVTLQVSEAAFSEIREKLETAEYSHCFDYDKHSGEVLVIDMTGIAITTRETD